MIVFKPVAGTHVHTAFHAFWDSMLESNEAGIMEFNGRLIIILPALKYSMNEKNLQKRLELA